MNPCKYCGSLLFEEKVRFSGTSRILHNIETDETELSCDTLEQDLVTTRTSKYFWCYECGKKGDLIPKLLEG